MQLSIYQWLQRLLVLHPDLSSSRIGSKPRGCDETSLFACDDHAIFSNVPGKAGVGHVMFLDVFGMFQLAELPWWCSCQVWGTQISVRKLSDSWDKTTNLKISTPKCPYLTVTLSIFSWIHWIYTSSLSHQLELRDVNSLQVLWNVNLWCSLASTLSTSSYLHTFIHVYPHIHSHFIHFSDFDLSTPGDKQPTPKWAGGAGSHGPWSAANTRVTSSDLTQLDAWWCLMRIFAKTGLPNCLGSCAGCPSLSYLRAELEGSDWLTRPVKYANIRSRRLWVLLNRIPLTLGIGML